MKVHLASADLQANVEIAQTGRLLPDGEISSFSAFRGHKMQGKGKGWQACGCVAKLNYATRFNDQREGPACKEDRS